MLRADCPCSRELLCSVVQGSRTALSSVATLPRWHCARAPPSMGVPQLRLAQSQAALSSKGKSLNSVPLDTFSPLLPAGLDHRP